MKISKKISNAFIILCFIGIGIIIISNYSRIQIEKSKQDIEQDIALTEDNFQEYSRVLKLTDAYNSILSNLLILGYVDKLDKLEEVTNDYEDNIEKVKNITMDIDNKKDLLNLIFEMDKRMQSILDIKKEELTLKENFFFLSKEADITKLKEKEVQLKQKETEKIKSKYLFHKEFLNIYSDNEYYKNGNKKEIEEFRNQLSIFDIEKIWEEKLNYILENFPNYKKIKLYNEQLYVNHINFEEYKKQIETEINLIEKNLPLFYSFTKIDEKDKKLLEFTFDALKLKLETIDETHAELLEIQNKITSRIKRLEDVQTKINRYREESLVILNRTFSNEIKDVERIINEISTDQKSQVGLKLKKINKGLVNNVKILKRVNWGVLGLVLFNLAILFVIFYYIMYKSVVKPLNHLENEMLDIKHDNFDKELDVVNDDEIGDLTMAINEMLKQMSNLYKQIAGQKKALEGRVQRRTVELAKLNKSLNDSLEKLKRTQKKLVESEKMASLGGLVAGVAHEVNTPVGVGVTAASYLKDETQKIRKIYDDEEMGQEDFESYLETAVNSSEIILKNLKKASTQIKNFKKVAIDQTSEVKREFIIKTYLEDVASSLYHELKQKNHKVEVTGDEDITLHSYPGVFSQIFSNLIMNSIIHGFEDKKNGKIKIEVNKKWKDELELIYSDNGKGIPSKNMDKIFEPFFTTKRGEGGSGLGMHILYNLVTHKLKGNVEVESEEGEGIKVIMTIPINE